MPFEPINECDCNYIKETVTKIDKLQKEIITVGEIRCISCDASLFSSANNTIPVALYTDCGTLVNGRVDLDGTDTTFFRIEAIRCNRFVTLRLLVADDTTDPTTLTATNRTMIFDLDHVAGIQCFEPITIELCQTSANS